MKKQSNAIRRNQKGKAHRVVEGRRNGRQIYPEAFTRFMVEQQGNCKPLDPRPFTIYNRKMRWRISNAIQQMAKYKAVGVDKFYVEILQRAPECFSRILAKVWETIENTLIVPQSWTIMIPMMGILVPLHKNGPEND